MNRRIKKTFDARGIEIPFPHQTLYWGVAKDGTAPPLRLAAAENEEAWIARETGRSLRSTGGESSSSATERIDRG